MFHEELTELFERQNISSFFRLLFLGVVLVYQWFPNCVSRNPGATNSYWYRRYKSVVMKFSTNTYIKFNFLLELHM